MAAIQGFPVQSENRFTDFSGLPQQKTAGVIWNNITPPH
jgi:hypothetical protein